MPLGTLAIRTKGSNPTHHLYRNGNLWWVHFFVHHSGFKARRVRKSLRTGSLAEAITRKDKLFEKIKQNGIDIPDRSESKRTIKTSSTMTDLPVKDNLVSEGTVQRVRRPSHLTLIKNIQK